MFKFAPYLFKTLWRHRMRTLLTVSGSAVALFVFCFVLSVQQGLERLTQQDNSVLVVFQANKFCPATSHLPQDYDRIIGEMPGVRDVVPIQVFTNNCRASLDVVVFYGTQVEKIRRLRNFELVTGSWADFEGHQDAAIVGRALATRRGIGWGEVLHWRCHGGRCRDLHQRKPSGRGLRLLPPRFSTADARTRSGRHCHAAGSLAR